MKYNKLANGGPILHVVHCVDTEGPMSEQLADTFVRLNEIFGLSLPPTAQTLKALQLQQIDLGGIEFEVVKVVAPKLLAYNESWMDIRHMLHDALSKNFREKLVDDWGGGWVYSWHCLDHVGYRENPRRKDIGYGNVFRFYKQILEETRSQCDEINWHFHPLSFSRNPLHCATSYVNSYDVLTQILCRRVIDDNWFPVVNRPGFHSERPDSHTFLEQWIPFDYANQYYEAEDDGQPDLIQGRFGDWRRAPDSWAGYHPAHDDYQLPGACRRWIFRCLNVGTRFRELKEMHVRQAFEEATHTGSAILAFCNHDYRDIRPDVDYVRQLLTRVRPDFPNVNIRFSGAAEAGRAHVHGPDVHEDPIELSLHTKGNRLFVDIERGRLFGPQPFLAVKTVGQYYFHDNFDVEIPGKKYLYTFDVQTLPIEQIDCIGVGGNGMYGNGKVVTLNVTNEKNADSRAE